MGKKKKKKKKKSPGQRHCVHQLISFSLARLQRLRVAEHERLHLELKSKSPSNPPWPLQHELNAALQTTQAQDASETQFLL